ncbi:MAG: bifunctional demethylmenaquinone methyltransferase/2-methoxy-6-polyprenyl-1,4-benzoquinol methylase UbiE [Cyanobacteria bacterium]|nr:bifunctional demethylmenaquinone methyltransferase/2-methoxy-6-polyprenyl-1,4-benzoquinol methylase UbiE [Cyanobacteriota bacterium]
MQSGSASESLNNKADFVQQMFNRIAPTYDFLNDCISFGMHRGWKASACKTLALKPGDSVLDVCTGTGDLTRYLLDWVGNSGRVTGLDFSDEMLSVARKRFAQYENIKFIQGDALNLPFDENKFDGAIVSFGLRNVSDIERCLQEMLRVVKPGGWVVNLDTSPKPNIPGYWFYFSTIMPVVGKLFSLDNKAYHYLSDSTKNFLTPDQLTDLFKSVGMTNVSGQTLAFGSVGLQAGQKKLD